MPWLVLALLKLQQYLYGLFYRRAQENRMWARRTHCGFMRWTIRSTAVADDGRPQILWYRASLVVWVRVASVLAVVRLAVRGRARCLTSPKLPLLWSVNLHDRSALLWPDEISANALTTFSSTPWLAWGECPGAEHSCIAPLARSYQSLVVLVRVASVSAVVWLAVRGRRWGEGPRCLTSPKLPLLLSANLHYRSALLLPDEISANALTSPNSTP